MTTTTANWGARDSAGVYLREAAFQFRSLLRTPGFALPTLLFPLMFYLFFGVVFAHGGPGSANAVLASLGTFGIIAPALFGFGVGIAMERERGILALKRVLPLPAFAYFFGKAAMSAGFAAILVILLFTIAATLGGVVLPPRAWLALAAVLIGGTLPFCLLGLVIGLAVNGQASAAVVNLIYLPMSFLSGLWIPLQFMPHFLQQFAIVLPAYHLGQLALGVVGTSNGSSVLGHVAYLAGFSLLCLIVAARSWRRIQDR